MKTVVQSPDNITKVTTEYVVNITQHDAYIRYSHHVQTVLPSHYISHNSLRYRHDSISRMYLVWHCARYVYPCIHVYSVYMHEYTCIHVYMLKCPSITYASIRRDVVCCAQYTKSKTKRTQLQHGWYACTYTLTTIYKKKHIDVRKR